MGRNLFPAHPFLKQALKDHLPKHLCFTLVSGRHLDGSSVLVDVLHQLANGNFLVANPRHDHVLPERFRCAILVAGAVAGGAASEDSGGHTIPGHRTPLICRQGLWFDPEWR